MTSIRDIRDNLVGVFTKELEVIGIGMHGNHKKGAEAIPFLEEDIQEATFRGDDESTEETKNIDKAKAAKILGIGHLSLMSLAKRGLIPGEYEKGLGWSFDRFHIESILKQKPEFLKKLWQHSRSVNRKNPVSAKEDFTEKIILGLDYASDILSIKKRTLIELIKKGEIPGEFDKDIGEWLFIKSDFEKLQIEKPALLLKIKELGLTT